MSYYEVRILSNSTIKC